MSLGYVYHEFLAECLGCNSSIEAGGSARGGTERRVNEALWISGNFINPEDPLSQPVSRLCIFSSTCSFILISFRGLLFLKQFLTHDCCPSTAS